MTDTINIVFNRILKTPLRAEGPRIKTVAGGYNVATVNRHMNDVDTYARVFAAAPEMYAALETILAGSEVTGRWIGPDGEECSKDDEGAVWEEYTAAEQAEWLQSVSFHCRNALAKADVVPPKKTVPVRAAIATAEAGEAGEVGELAELADYHKLHDGLSDMIEGGRLTRDMIPDDYDWLVETLASIRTTKATVAPPKKED